MIGIASVVGVQAQDMKALFVSMPDSIAPLLTKVNREDCIDFLASNMKAEVKTGSVSRQNWRSWQMIICTCKRLQKAVWNEIATIEWFGENRMYGEYSVCIRLW